ncbi:putative mitochondrial hypothetical protein [Leptomonas pyrrhocoris]|uniref:3-hydroxyacyl-CoA dehydrogenase C-terminal domain-containing protein n=1 Tax=Leptomonas pyrrhocoris TaxID=157538 RepID=A0A0N0E008_LEPPY|nr:putative mitochondrial hypothetical protein [Leptomonas pyrrhocoris]KPA85882.1 putative mitochondrial hypothetical protein [Leptomonas pyrrhocoris]|eukprot:XP_015664321.1 putative mitochondrial hypothetical protein [Leptomonas pyrrhocoris]
MPVGPPAPNATPKAPKSPPEAPKAAPEAPQSPPEAPKSPPEAPKAAPEAPKSPPEAPKSPPEAPKAAPKAPKAAPEAPRSPPEAPRSPPEAPKAAPKAPKAAPEAPKSPPEAPKAAPEAPRSPPEAPRSPPEAPKAAPKAPKAAPEAPKAASTSAPRAHHANGKPSQMSHKPTDKSASPLSRTVVATGRLGQSLGHGKAAAPPPSPTPPPPPPPPPQPQAPTSTAATPPASLVVASLHVSIAPPEKTEADGSMNSIKADASEQELFEALRPSLSTRVEEAVRHGKATHPLRAVRTGASHAETAETAAAATPPPPLDESPGDWSSARREGKLQPLPMTIASSLNRHEIPSDLGGAESTTADAASSPTEDSIEHDSNLSARPNATEVHETPVVERLPGEVWRGVMTRAANTAPASESIDEQDSENCITVSVAGSSVMPGRGLTVQLRKSFFGAMVALQAVSRALDAVEARCGEMIANGSDNGNSSGASGTTPPSPVTVTWCTLPHCTFFGSVQSPAEFSLKQRVAYVEAKEAVMQKFHQLVHCMKGKAHFVALASCAAGPVLDLGAEIFFACPERYLLPARASTITEFRSGRATAVPAMSVGFPLTRVGFYPSTCTVAALQRICGSQSTIKWVPILHSYDASSLEGVGLLRLGEPSPSSSVEADVVSHAAGTFRWSLWCERVLLRYLCRTPMQRQWVMEKLLWSNDFQRKVRPSPAAVSGVDARFMETTWYTYAMSVLCRSETAQAESEKVFHEGNSKKDAAGDVDGSAALVRACVAAPPCRGAAHAVQVRLRSLRHVLPLLPHRRFLAFPYHQTSSWAAKMQALTAASESPGAAVLLDCSDKAVAATVKLVETQLVASAAQRGRLPYLNVILIGEDAAVRAVLALLPCAAVVSSTSAFHEQGHASVQQVRLFAAPQWPVDLQQDTLVAALAYLQRKETPHVVAAGPAPQRLLLALCREALVMAQSLPDASRIESAAQEHLGLRLGPFALIDAYGAATLASMAAAATAEEAAQTKAAATAPHSVSPNALLESCTRAMAREGLLGVRSARGGFYGAATAVAGNGGGAARVLRDAVVDTYVRHHASPAEMADRLRAAVLNAACELLVRGEVPGVEDVDLLSLSTLGWREETGGVLYQVDQCGAEGLPRLVQLMLCLSSTGVAPHLAPHPLLSAMAAQQLRFANLRSSGLLPS